MPVRLHDTLSRSEKLLAPASEGPLGFYCCGPTVYGPAHIGNFRTFILQDVLRRTLEADGMAVRHVRNITDVDDKTIRTSQAEGVSLKDFTQKWTEKFHADCARLNLLTPDEEPRATDHIAEQISMIEKLVEGGHAYAAEDGSVYFKVNSCEHYGELAQLDRDSLRTQSTNSAGESNDADEYDRESVSDFALWKAHKPDDGENFWPSPWGNGRPGWHIECSAMSVRYLGESFDLHGGGVDLCFPHHENEIAQSECATGARPFVRHWFHSTHLMVDGAKMSKSLGNLYTLDELEAKGYSPNVVRWALIAGHYRQQLNFTDNGLQAAKSAISKIEKHVSALLDRLEISKEDFAECYGPNPLLTTGIFAPAWEALCDDLNTPGAIGELFTALRNLDNPDFSKVAVGGQLRALAALLFALGIELFQDEKNSAEAPENVRMLAQQRWEAKQAKDWTSADALRAEIQAAGWNILDKKDGFDLEPA
ncbi:cysteine--tRNA ligase [Rubellicoccus peritrichatus]|uniref:Cysteine--tRNA ligase n=1 Tax=Rubellicoccus peritrichatus TaxID=3080537 RepID=A0AAQ3QVL5_9BACT|nr:cysteine--tRNA ligase [Puniceicoccus sp. CR14]WOO41748.1 cysteine--tRNA ligase [Puniceicoccus sp. CR14]